MKNCETEIIGKFQSISIPSRLPCAALAIALAGTGLFAGPEAAQAAGPCQTSAKQAHVACSFDVRDDYWESKATCSQLSDVEERAQSLDEAAETRGEEWEECRERLAARLDFCALSGEKYYDPPFEAGMFTDVFMNNNPYWPLEVGNYWEFEGEEEVIVVNVLDATKRIDGVDCIVVNDVVSDEDGNLIEDTDDWYIYALNGDVHYCGENSRDFEYFEGDDPEIAELVAIDGSFKQGVDGAKAGIVMRANPQVGDIYR